MWIKIIRLLLAKLSKEDAEFLKTMWLIRVMDLFTEQNLHLTLNVK